MRAVVEHEVPASAARGLHVLNHAGYPHRGLVWRASEDELRTLGTGVAVDANATADERSGLLLDVVGSLLQVQVQVDGENPRGRTCRGLPSGGPSAWVAPWACRHPWGGRASATSEYLDVKAIIIQPLTKGNLDAIGFLLALRRSLRLQFGSMTTMDCFHFLALASLRHLPPIRLEDAQPFPGLTLWILTLANASTALALDEVIARAKHAAEALADDRHVEIREGLGTHPGLPLIRPRLLSLSLDLRVGVLILLIRVHGIDRIVVLVVLPVGRVLVLVVLPVAAAIAAASACSGVIAGASRLTPGDSSMGDGTIIAAAIIASGNLGLSASSFTSDTIGLSEKTAEGQVAVVPFHRGERILESDALAGGESAPVAARRRNREVLLSIR